MEEMAEMAEGAGETVAVVGASRKAERYSHRALRMLLEHGYRPAPVSLRGEAILGLPGYASLAAVPSPIHTVTMYLSPEKQAPVLLDILTVRPTRVVFNPGAENPTAYPTLAAHGIAVIEACTLVLLTTGQFKAAC
jgi:predicted CoA-binding protein